MSKNEVVLHQGGAGAPVPERATRVASWVGWHLFEIAGVTVPAVVAVSGTPWWLLVSGVVGAGWTVHEVRVTQGRRRCSVTAPGSPRGFCDTSDLVASVSDGESSGAGDEGVGGVR